MPRINPDAIRRNRAAELDSLARLLSAARIVADPYPLHAAASECREGRTTDQDFWRYTVVGLILRTTPTLRRIRPQGAVDVAHTLNVSLIGVCADANFAGDPFTALAVDIIGRARIEGLPLICSWHLDRHLAGPNDEEPGEIHPLYHFQFGGREMSSRMDSGTSDFGELLLLDPPRIAHPPLDALLAVDFVLSNFYMDARRRLFADPEYKRIIREAQIRCWKSYADAAARPWHTTPPVGIWGARDLWPHLP